MLAESAGTGTRPPAQLPPVAQSVDTAPVQVRVVPVTSNDMLPLCTPSVTVMGQVPDCTPVTSPPPTVTVAHAGLALAKLSVPVGITTPTLFFTTGTGVCVSPGCRLPKE